MEIFAQEFEPAKVPSLKEVNFGKVKLWAVEHFWTDFDLRKSRDNKVWKKKIGKHNAENKKK